MKQILAFALLLFSTTNFANPVIENTQGCSMKDLPVVCENGDKIKLDVIRSHDERGDIYLNINTKDQIGNSLELSIDGKTPQVLKIEHGSKGAYIPRNVILKLRSASSVHFKINMHKSNPIAGQLNDVHFEWLKLFGKVCS